MNSINSMSRYLTWPPFFLGQYIDMGARMKFDPWGPSGLDAQVASIWDWKNMLQTTLSKHFCAAQLPVTKKTWVDTYVKQHKANDDLIHRYIKKNAWSRTCTEGSFLIIYSMVDVKSPAPPLNKEDFKKGTYIKFFQIDLLLFNKNLSDST